MYKNPLDQKACVLKWKKEHPEQKRALNKLWLEKHPSYINFQGMMNRVYNQKHTQYRYYGGKGIEVSPTWRTFATYEKEFGYAKPGKGYTVDRIDNSGNYEPGNVQWLTSRDNNGKRYAQSKT